MKKFYNIAIAILFVLVLILFYLQVSTKKQPTNKAITTTNSTANTSNMPMAFFDIDSINENYTYCVEIKTKLENLKDKMDGELSNKQKNLEATQAAMQKKAEAGSMTQQELEQARVTLNKMQQDIAVQKDTYIQQFETERKNFELALKKEIQEFIKNYNTPQRFAYIIADEPDIFYYRDTAYNITSAVLSGLNANYKSSNKK